MTSLDNQESEASHGDLQKGQSISASLQDRKNGLQRYVLKKPAPSHKLRVEDVATREIDQYIHSPCPEV